MGVKKHTFSEITESDILGKTIFRTFYFPDVGYQQDGDVIFLVLENFFLESFLSIPSSISSWLDHPRCFLDPLIYTHPSFSKQFWGERYNGDLSLFEYLRSRGVQGRLRYNYLSDFALIEHWIHDQNAVFDLYHD